MFAWIKVNHISYICEITQVDFLNKKCECRIGDVEFTEVPFSEFQNIRDELLPWQKCETCAYHDDFSWVCFNPEAEDRADFTDNEHKCGCWTSREDEPCEKKFLRTGQRIC